MPMPVVEPSPLPPADERPAAPLDAHEASYFAASASRASLRGRSIGSGTVYVYGMGPAAVKPVPKKSAAAAHASPGAVELHRPPAQREIHRPSLDLRHEARGARARPRLAVGGGGLVDVRRDDRVRLHDFV